MDTLLLMDLLLILVILLIAALNHFLPRLTRREIFFAVTVSHGYRETQEARKTIGRYRAAVWIHALIATCLVVASSTQNLDWLKIAAIFWLAGGCFVAYLRARHETLPHAESPVPQREAAVAPRPPVSSARGGCRQAPSPSWRQRPPTCISIGTRFRKNSRFTGVGTAGPTDGPPEASAEYTALC